MKFICEEKTSERLPFLDVILIKKKKGGKFEFRIYRKNTVMERYNSKDSYHSNLIQYNRNFAVGHLKTFHQKTLNSHVTKYVSASNLLFKVLQNYNFLHFKNQLLKKRRNKRYFKSKFFKGISNWSSQIRLFSRDIQIGLS